MPDCSAAVRRNAGWVKSKLFYIGGNADAFSTIHRLIQWLWSKLHTTALPYFHKKRYLTVAKPSRAFLARGDERALPARAIQAYARMSIQNNKVSSFLLRFFFLVFQRRKNEDI